MIWTIHVGIAPWLEARQPDGPTMSCQYNVAKATATAVQYEARSNEPFKIPLLIGY